MISTRQRVIALFLALGQGQCLAQVLYGPMRPPAIAGTGEQTSGGERVLQSTLLSQGRRIAIIDGKPMNVGDRIGAARIVSIDASTVTLSEANRIMVLQLYHGVKVTGPGAAKAPASRKGAKEGAK